MGLCLVVEHTFHATKWRRFLNFIRLGGYSRKWQSINSVCFCSWVVDFETLARTALILDCVYGSIWSCIGNLENDEQSIRLAHYSIKVAIKLPFQKEDSTVN